MANILSSRLLGLVFLCTRDAVSRKEKKGWLYWLYAFFGALQMDSVLPVLNLRPGLTDGIAIVGSQTQHLAGYVNMRLGSPSFLCAQWFIFLISKNFP